MQTRLNPYLSFRGNAREVVDFYQSVFGGTVRANTFKELGMSQDSSEDDLLAHSMLEADNGLVLMASDMPERMEYRAGNNMSISLSGDDEAELRGYYDKLAQGGTVMMPLQKASWGDSFGMLNDKFGITWLVNISPAQS